MKKIFILLFLMSGSLAHAQMIETSSLPGPVMRYDTVALKGGLKLYFEKTEIDRWIRLTGPGVDTIIRTIRIKAPAGNLGHLSGDFENVFAVTHGDNLPSVQVFSKKNGQMVFEGYEVDIDKARSLIYYIDRNKEYQLAIYHVDSGKKEYFAPVVTSCRHWFECISGKQLSETEFVLEYFGPDNERLKKVYPRNP
jgi:hypothetical protein